MEIKRSLKAWKDKLPKKAVISKLLAKQASRDYGMKFRDRRHFFNRALEKIALKFRAFATINPDCIIPGDDAMFSTVSSKLSSTGWYYFWRPMDDQIREFDHRNNDDARFIIEEQRNSRQFSKHKPKNKRGKCLAIQEEFWCFLQPVPTAVVGTAVLLRMKISSLLTLLYPYFVWDSSNVPLM